MNQKGGIHTEDRASDLCNCQFHFFFFVDETVFIEYTKVTQTLKGKTKDRRDIQQKIDEEAPQHIASGKSRGHRTILRRPTMQELS